MSLTPQAARDRIVGALVDDAFASAHAHPNWLRGVFRTGIVGFENLDNVELLQCVSDAGFLRHAGEGVHRAAEVLSGQPRDVKQAAG